MPGTDIDPTFLTLPYRELAAAALSRLTGHGVQHGDFRFERVRNQHIAVRDEVVQGVSDTEVLGFAVRVVHHGAWGFAAGSILTVDEAVRVAEQAISVALVASQMTSSPVQLAAEPTYNDVTWTSAYEIDPTTISIAEKSALLTSWSQQLRSHSAVGHATASLRQVHEIKFYADLAGSSITQQRMRLQPLFEAMGANSNTGMFDSMRTLAAPVGRGWEYLTDGYDWDAEWLRRPNYWPRNCAHPASNRARTTSSSIRLTSG